MRFTVEAMHTCPKRLATVLLLAVLAVTVVQQPAGAAQEGTRVRARVQLVGDSLARSVEDDFPADWRVRARGGRALYESMPILSRARSYTPACVVVALGTNDVGQHRTRLQMSQDLDEAASILAGMDCVAWTTVKVDRVNPIYGASWARYARMWNTLLRSHVEGTILDWDRVAQAHPGYFAADGVHLTASGQTAYANFLRRGVPAA